MNLDETVKLLEGSTDYLATYKFIQSCLANDDDKSLLIEALNTPEKYFLYDYLAYSYADHEVYMPIELFFELIKLGAKLEFKSHDSLESLIYTLSYHEFYNPISIYLLENSKLYQQEFNIFELGHNNIILFHHFFYVDNLELLKYVINTHEKEELKSSIDNTIYSSSYATNVLSLLLSNCNFSNYLVEKLQILDNLGIDFNHYLLVDFIKNGPREETTKAYPHILTPLSMVKARELTDATNFFLNHPQYNIGEYIESLPLINMMRYVFGGSDVMTQGLEKREILTERYKISLTMNEKEGKNKDRIKM